MPSEQSAMSKGLTEEEWCELCFRVAELDSAHAQLITAILAQEAPTLQQVLKTTSAYKDVSVRLVDYVVAVLRERAGINGRMLGERGIP
jgi:hypothetical protein